MLYGNMIFIKKTGEDGSKFPVTEKSIKIGRGEDCLIRIHNPQVALEHCQLIIDDNGQAKLKNISKITTLNGKRVSQGEVSLCHGDVFKLGERLVRWEYLASSKYYKQLQSPGGRLLAVVMPQQRALNGQLSSVASTSGTPVSKNTPNKRKQRNSEAFESLSSKKGDRIGNANKTPKGLNNLAKFLSSRHSLQGSKALFSPMVKQRKSTSGISSSKASSQEKSRKSTMASWKVKLVTPPSDKKTNVKKTPVNKSISLIKQSEMGSGRKSIIKTPTLKTVSETPFVQLTKDNSLSPEIVSSTPSKKSTPKLRLVQSEKKMSFDKRKVATSPKRLSFKPKVKTSKSDVKKIHNRLSKSLLLSYDSNQSTDMFDSYVLLKNVSNDVIMQSGLRKGSPKKGSPAKKSSEKVQSTSKKVNTLGMKRASTRVSESSGELSSPSRKAPKLELKSSPSTPPSLGKEASKSPPKKTPKSKVKSTSKKRVSVSAKKSQKSPKAKKSLMKETNELSPVIVKSEVISPPAKQTPASSKKTPKEKAGAMRSEGLILSPKNVRTPSALKTPTSKAQSSIAKKSAGSVKKTPKGGRIEKIETPKSVTRFKDLNMSPEGLKLVPVFQRLSRSSPKSPDAKKSPTSVKKTPKSAKVQEKDSNLSPKRLKSPPTRTTPRSQVKFIVPQKKSVKKTPEGRQSFKKETPRSVRRLEEDLVQLAEKLKSTPAIRTPISQVRSPGGKKSPASLKKTPKVGIIQNEESSTPSSAPEDDPSWSPEGLKLGSLTPRMSSSRVKSPAAKKSPASVKKTPKGGKMQNDKTTPASALGNDPSFSPQGLKSASLTPRSRVKSPAAKKSPASVKKTPKGGKMQSDKTTPVSAPGNYPSFSPQGLKLASLTPRSRVNSPAAKKSPASVKKTPKSGKIQSEETPSSETPSSAPEDDPSWSPEGLKLASRMSTSRVKSPAAKKSSASVKKTPKGGKIQSEETSSSETPSSAPEDDPSWSPEGLKLASRTSTSRVKSPAAKKSPASVKKTPKGGKIQSEETFSSETPSSAPEDDPSWSPEGLKLASLTPRSRVKSPAAKKSPASVKKTPRGGKIQKKDTPLPVGVPEEDSSRSLEGLKSTPGRTTPRSQVKFTVPKKGSVKKTPKSEQSLKKEIARRLEEDLNQSTEVLKSPVSEKAPRSGKKSPAAKKSPGSTFKTPKGDKTQKKETPRSVKRLDLNQSAEGLKSPSTERALRSEVKSPVAKKSPVATKKTPKVEESPKKETPKSIKMQEEDPKRSPKGLKSPPARKSPRSEVKSPVARKSSVSVKKTPKGGKSPTKETSGSAREALKELNVLIRDLNLPSTERTPGSKVASSPASLKKSTVSVKKTPKAEKSPLKEKPSSARGVRRKLSPSLSSAEIAAKKLKTSSPRKPDKNKKAALLVLGKANRKQVMSQNVKVLLKQKIVKKAIKQSTVLPVRKDKKPSKAVKKAPKKRIAKLKKKPAGKGTPKNEKATIRALKLAEALINENSSESKALKEKSSSLSRGNVPLQSPSSIITSPSKGSPSKQKTEKSPGSRVTFSPVKQTSFFSSSFANSLSLADYSFAANRRCSKRLSSKNENSRPDFMELSPTALGLIPKNVGMFRTSKEVKRKSSSLTTPKNVQTTGIIKSASTSKIANRKIVRFSSRDESFSPSLESFNSTKDTDFDFDSVRTPNIATDFFVSPLSMTTGSKSEASKSKKASGSAKSKASPKIRKSAECVRKLLQSPPSPVSSSAMEVEQSKKTPKSVFSPQRNKSASKTGSGKGSPKNDLIAVSPKSPGKDLFEALGVTQLLKSPKDQNPDVIVVEKSSPLPKTPKVLASPKSASKKVGSEKKILPKQQKSPKNDLSNVSGVKKLLKTPKLQKSPKNDLTNVSGVKKLLKTPKVQKSPKNDLSDLRGVKELLGSPKNQKTPKNDLSDVRGVKRLLKTPKVQKSPKNDLSDLKGVKRLLGSPKTQKSPKNDLTNVAGVKKLLKTPRVQKSPKNDLTNVQGVKRLLKTPREAKSPKNDLTDVRGVKRLLKTPRVQKSPKNDLSDLRGVSKLLKSPQVQKDPKNSLMDVSGVVNLFNTPEKPRTPQKAGKEPAEILPQRLNISVTGVKQLLVAESPVSSSLKTAKKVKDYRSIRGRRTIYSTPKGPKNDLTDVVGVRELFARNKPTNDLDISFSGVAELFEIPTIDTSVQKREITKSAPKKSVRKTAKVSVISQKSRRVLNNSSDSEVKVVPTRGRGRKAAAVVEKKAVRSKRNESESKVVSEKKPPKRRAVKEVSVVAAKKALKSPVKKTTRGRKKKEETVEEVDMSEKTSKVVIGSRKRKTPPAKIEPSPPKLRRRQAVSTQRAPSKEVPKKTTKEKEPSEAVPETRVSKTRGTAKSSKLTKATKTTTKVQSKTSKTPTKKPSAKSIPKVQKGRSQAVSTAKKSEDGDQISPRRTRNAKAKTGTQEKSQVQKKVSGVKTVKSTVAKKKLSPPVKRSTRRK